MLPNVESDDRLPLVHVRAVLVWRCLDGQLPGFVHDEPRPAGTEDACRRFRECVFEFWEVTECSANDFAKIAAWLTAAGGASVSRVACAARVFRRRHDRPEKRMIAVSPAMVLDRFAYWPFRNFIYRS